MFVDLAKGAGELDLEARLRQVPSTAMVRGIFFTLLRDQLERQGFSKLPELAALLREPRSSWQLYSARELLQVYASAAEVIHRNPHEGLRKIFAGIAPGYAATWYGQVFRRFLPDPATALRYIERARERVANYGRWRVETVDATHVVLHMFDEYFWIESAQRGGCEGLLAACNVEGEVRAELDSAFRGRLEITWRPRRPA